MFFSCTTCGTRLQLPDEQVVNRILKVRCTACSAVMTVRDSITGKHERPSEPTWFVAVQGQQRGPMSLDELRGVVSEGVADAASYVWSAGMLQWTRAGEVDALKTLFDAPPPLPAPALDTSAADALALAAALADARARAAAEVQARSDTEARAQANAAALREKAALAEHARAEAAEIAKRERLAAEAAAREAVESAERERLAADAAAQAREVAEAQARAQAEAQAREVAEAQARQAQARAQAEAQAREVAEAQARARAEAQAREVAEAQARVERERQEASVRARAQAEALADAAAKARAEAESLEAAARAAADAIAEADRLTSEAEIAAELTKTHAEATGIIAARSESTASIPALQEATGVVPAHPELSTDVALAEASISAQLGPPDLPAPLPPKAKPPPIDVFASAKSQPEPVDIFAMSESRPAPSDLFALPEVPPPHSTLNAELAALRQEFSVVARQPSRKRWLWIGIAVVVAAAIAVLLLMKGEGSTTGTLTTDAAKTTRKPYETVEKRLPSTPAPAIPQATSEAVEPAHPELDEAAKAEPKKLDPKAKVGLVVPTVDPSVAALNTDKLQALAPDESGKTETRIVFDPGQAARDKAVADATAKKAAAADALSEEVALAFGKKKTQFAKCSDTTQERVKVVFTVTVTGKTSDTEIQGTGSVDKTRCIKAIMDRSVFPAGDMPLTYGQILVL